MKRLLQELDLLPPAERGRVFEHTVVPWILREAPVYRNVVASVSRWNEYRSRHQWGADLGIDLIAEERSGRVWAIQAKAHTADHDVTWTDISTFVGASAARPEVDCLLLVTTAQQVGSNARKQLQNCGRPTVIIDRERLLDLGLPNDVGLADLASPRPPPPSLTPRAHQVEAIAAAVNGFQHHPRGQVIHACGTGKTLTALWIMEALASKRTIVFCPSLGLVDQTLREWTAHRSVPFSAVVVCSDPSVGAAGEESAGDRVAELTIPPTTDAEHLRAALKVQPEGVVVFATYQSSAVVAEALRGTEWRFDLLVADEAHHAAGRTDGDFYRPLDDKAIGADRRLFLTATPRIFRSTEAPDEGGETNEVASMSDITKFGPVFHQLSFRTAIERDLLSDYRIVILGVAPGEVKSLLAVDAYVSHDGEDIATASELATHIGLARAMREFGIRRALSFHSRVANAAKFAKRFERVTHWLAPSERPVASVWTGTLSGEDSIHRRRQLLRRLSEGAGGEYGLVTNARCLSEGVDVPAIDGIVFVDPKSSRTSIVQAVGRAIRKSEDKTGVSTVILPVVVPDEADDAAGMLEGSAYAYVWRTIDALRSHDVMLGEELDALRRESAMRGAHDLGDLPRRIVVRLPRRVGASFAAAFSLRIVEGTTSIWEVGYAHLALYRGLTGNCLVANDFVSGTRFRLGGWVAMQRTRADRLTPERRARLDALSFVWDIQQQNWEVGFAHLKAFHALRGHCRVERDFVTVEGFKLGQWVKSQRNLSATIATARRARLDALGFVWGVNSDKWNRGYERLQAFHASNGHVRVEGRFITSDNFRLGEWVDGQRRRMTELTPLQRGQLEVLGIEGDPQSDLWEEGVRHLADFHAKYGHCRVPSRAMREGFDLGAWVLRQRQTAETLPPERREHLDALGFVWDRWLLALSHLTAFRERNGHFRVPYNFRSADKFRLGEWVYGLRRSVKQMPRWQRERLESLGFDWDLCSREWTRGLEALRAYHEKHRHTAVPFNYSTADHFELGKWVSMQRVFRAQHSPLEEEQLNDLKRDFGVRHVKRDFARFDAARLEWEEGLACLSTYRERYGHVRVPLGYVVEGGLWLGNWVARQRALATTLSSDQRNQLDSVGFDWDAASGHG